MAATERPAMPLPERPLIGRLREQLRAVETALGLDGPAPPLALGIPAIDSALGGGLSRGALHEIAAAREADTAAATGFASVWRWAAVLAHLHPGHRPRYCGAAARRYCALSPCGRGLR